MPPTIFTNCSNTSTAPQKYVYEESPSPKIANFLPAYFLYPFLQVLHENLHAAVLLLYQNPSLVMQG